MGLHVGTLHPAAQLKVAEDRKLSACLYSVST